MSKVSFRARALDATKPLPIFHATDIPDISDYSAINRTVPQMPTGMEKEEETVGEKFSCHMGWGPCACRHFKNGGRMFFCILCRFLRFGRSDCYKKFMWGYSIRIVTFSGGLVYFCCSRRRILRGYVAEALVQPYLITCDYVTRCCRKRARLL